MYIAIEGIDTAGKTTQIELLNEKLNNKVKDNVLFIKEPGYTNVGKKIREILLNDGLNKKSELFLFLADRNETVNQVILKNEDKLIITDRSLISGIAYSFSYFDLDFLLSINKFATENVVLNKVIILKLDEGTLRFRLSQKNLDKIELRGIDYLLQVQDNLIKVTKKLNIPFLVIDASLDKDVINEKILNFINEDL